MKTHSGAKKRFRLLGNGKIKRKRQHKRHLLLNKSPKRKRKLGRTAYVAKSCTLAVRKLLGVN